MRLSVFTTDRNLCCALSKRRRPGLYLLFSVHKQQHLKKLIMANVNIPLSNGIEAGMKLRSG